MKSTDIRSRFLDFFARHDHRVVPSSSLVPANDPTLLFTNAGMVQFKDVFLGQEKRPYTRAASSQRCLRAGGKHNDLENVGYTARHHTFFEMLGNFSFGDYFKREAIQYAWTFLTEDMKLPPERLWVTVFENDDEAAKIWLDELKVDPKRFSRLGEKSNFWQMGDTGPCGPCSEIFYDHGPHVPGGPPGSPDEDGDRYVEIWNLVFMQFERDAQGTLHPLPKPSVDTGMGLERMAAVMQGVHSNYDTDLFQALIRAAAEVIGVRDMRDKSLNVVADHIRACAFLITDGVVPLNEGRGYVLRRIVRRALRHGHRLGAQLPFFYKLVPALVKEMGDAYPELMRAQEQVQAVLRQEEERFAETLSQGLKILDQDIGMLKGKTIPGTTVFRLYDTYGFPVDLTADIARERGLTLDMEGFERQMAAQRERARAAMTFKAGTIGGAGIDAEFSGYETLRDQGTVVAMRDLEGRPVEELRAGQEAIVFLDRTPFYAESGGQVGDSGRLTGPGASFSVRDTQKGHAHIGKMELGVLRVGDKLTGDVDQERRRATANNHSATHLLHAALKKVLGSHVQQKGSLVAPERLRFDFTHTEAVSPEQIVEIERIVNQVIRLNTPVETRVMAIDEAMACGAVALFGEKYGDRVRVVGMGGEFSTELCGGTHVARTGDIGFFKIVSEGGVAAGVRRIEAVTGESAVVWAQELEARLGRVATALRSNADEVERKIDQALGRARSLEKEIAQLQARLASGAGVDLVEQAKEVKGVQVLAVRMDGLDAKGLREAVDRFKSKLGQAAVVLASVQDAKVTLVAGVAKELTGQVPAGELVNHVAQQIGGKGGGRADFAQAGGNDPSRLDGALDGVADWVAQRLK